MARSDAVWGIDVGQCALKALRCRPGADAGQIVADAFDYVEYPKILSQPEADPVALVQDALKQFLSRNSVRGDRVAISVPGQSGLARFIKLPPVESKKIPDIVKYEARQQIPFSLEDVVWDYQKMVGGSEEEGFSLETEVGLFAMKRDQVYRALKPFTDAGIEVDIVQLTPLALYNYIAFDQMRDLPPPAEYDPESPPPSVVLLSLGTDSTDLVVTNGYRVWQRSVPLGGNHFTKALTKELKLTFATAEHLKRNAAKAEDPKALFQAMRPVFNDLLTEVQRSIGYFSNLDRRAKIGRVLSLGNAMKLPGLQRYLAQNLGFEFQRVENFAALTGPSVVDAPAFKDNVLSFGVCYGLAVQGLKESAIKTNLLPRELMRDRMIRSKKPWAVGAAAALLLGCTLSYFGYWRAWNSVLLDGYFSPVVKAADNVVKQTKDYETKFTEAKTSYKKTADIGQSLLPSVERRERWLTVVKAINLCLPAEDGEPPADLSKRKTLNIVSLEAQHVDDLAAWYGSVRVFDKPDAPPAGAEPAPGAGNEPNAGTGGAQGTAKSGAGLAAAGVGNAGVGGNTGPAGVQTQTQMAVGGAGASTSTPGLPDPATLAGPTGAGWVISMRGYHFHNSRSDTAHNVERYVEQTLIRKLKAGKVTLPPEDRQEGEPTEIDLKKLGLEFPVVLPANGGLNHSDPQWEFTINPPDTDVEVGADGQPVPLKPIPAPIFEFVVQLCWRDEPPAEKKIEGIEGAAPTTGTTPLAVPNAVPTDVPPAAMPEQTPDGVPPPNAPQPGEPPMPPAGDATVPPPAGDATTPPATTEPPASTEPPAGNPAPGDTPAVSPPAGTPDAAPPSEPPATPPAAPPTP